MWGCEVLVGKEGREEGGGFLREESIEGFGI